MFPWAQQQACLSPHLQQFWSFSSAKKDVITYYWFNSFTQFGRLMNESFAHVLQDKERWGPQKVVNYFPSDRHQILRVKMFLDKKRYSTKKFYVFNAFKNLQLVPNSTGRSFLPVRLQSPNQSRYELFYGCRKEGARFSKVHGLFSWMHAQVISLANLHWLTFWTLLPLQSSRLRTAGNRKKTSTFKTIIFVSRQVRFQKTCDQLRTYLWIKSRLPDFCRGALV